MEDSITVSIPYYRCSETVERTVNSVLNQTHKNLVVVVVVDGDNTPPLPKDERLVVYRLPENRGRYFADAVALAACNTDWFTVHDADDWSDKNRLKLMLSQNRRNNPVIAGGEKVYLMNGKTFHMPPKRYMANKMGHLWHMSALYRTSLLQGLIHPGFRVGYDSLLCNILALNVDVTYVPQPLYHRVSRRDSLMQSDFTGMHSQFRRDEVIRLHKLFDEIKRNSKQQEALPLIRDLIIEDCEAEILSEVSHHAESLYEMLPRIPAQDASDVVLTTLTGGRPELLRETLYSLYKHYPEVAKTSEWIVYVNGNDKESLDVLRPFMEDIDRVIASEDMTPIGESISLLAEEASSSEKTYWLHLEDDWQAGINWGWLDQAREILKDPRISQVRLRQAWEKVLTRHMVTKQPLRWRDQGRFRYALAHLTFNPSLVRVKDIKYAWPCTGEGDAQRKWHKNKKIQVAQLIPGVWGHIGHVSSLRKRISDERSARHA